MKKITIITLSTIIIFVLIYFFVSILSRDPKIPEPTPTIESNTYKVVEVIDGDTIKVSISGGIETVRVIGIDTPETVDPRGTIECYGTEASERAKELLTGKQVTLESDPTQDDRDKYDRLLRYVSLGDTDFGMSMIEDGYAYEYTYEVPYEHQSSYMSLETIARATGVGLWSVDTCNGST